MKREFRPEPDPAGSLQPPNRVPPTAIGAATPPQPEPEPEPVRVRRRQLASPALTMIRLLLGVPMLGLKLGARVVRGLSRRRRAGATGP